MNKPIRLVYFLIGVFTLCHAATIVAQDASRLTPPKNDAEAAERGLHFSIPLSLDPDPNLFWVEYVDAAGKFYYIPVQRYDDDLPAIKQGIKLYPERDLSSTPIAAKIDTAVEEKRAAIEPILDGFESVLRDGIKENREDRRGPVSLSPDQAEALAKRSLAELEEMTDTGALLGQLTGKLRELDGQKGVVLIKVRKQALEMVINAILSERYAGTFAPDTRGTMRSHPPLPPPATQPWTTANDFPTGIETTFVDSPHNRDGTIDYGAAFHDWLGSRVKPEDNAFTLLAPYTSFAGYHEQSYVAALVMYKKLGTDAVPIIVLENGELPPTDVLYTALAKPHFYVPHVLVGPHQQMTPWFTMYKYHLLDQLLGWRDALVQRSQDQFDQDQFQSSITDAALAIALMQHGADQPDLGAQPEWDLPYQAVSLLLKAAEAGELTAEQWGRIRPLLTADPATSMIRSRVRQSRMIALNLIMQAAAGKRAPANMGDMSWNFLTLEIAKHNKVVDARKDDLQLYRHELFDTQRAIRRINGAFDRIEQKWVDLPLPKKDRAVSRELEGYQALFGSFILALSRNEETRRSWIDRLPELHDAEDSKGWTDHVTDMVIAQTMVGHVVNMPAYIYRKRFMFDAIPALVAIHMHRNQHNAWPETLGDLVPGLLKSVPIDPHNGEPVNYAIQNGKPVLWSVGEDLLDEKGEGDDRVMPMPDREIP